MKLLLLIAAFAFSTVVTCGQTSGIKKGKNSSSGNSKIKSSAAVKDAKTKQSTLPAGTAIRGGKAVPLYHGKHDYTPGSPIGTGGAGGNTMSGSPQGSASENAIGNKPSDELLKKNNTTKPKNKKGSSKTD